MEEYFDEMKSNNIFPDSVTYASISTESVHFCRLTKPQNIP